MAFDSVYLVLLLFKDSKSLKDFKREKKSLNWQNDLTVSHQCSVAALLLPFDKLHWKIQGHGPGKSKV